MLMSCGKNISELGIKLSEGISLSAFIRHLEKCRKCDKERVVLTDKLNSLLRPKK